MTPPKRITDVPHACVALAIMETVRDHADHYTGGEINRDDLLCGLVEVTSTVLAEIRNERERDAYRNAVLASITQVTFAKVEEQRPENSLAR